ncbi:MAG: Lrp/AsnC family transcriptional regulator, partial [Chloroflexota bacterium]|nr:Lrp/AsnC family transcriptional regulator [Chloroflexota bacterium]
CYQRPIYPSWPYNMYTMIHTTSREGCVTVARQVSQRTEIRDYVLLYSTKEYKKDRIRYFA